MGVRPIPVPMIPMTPALAKALKWLDDNATRSGHDAYGPTVMAVLAAYRQAVAPQGKWKAQEFDGRWFVAARHNHFEVPDHRIAYIVRDALNCADAALTEE